MNRSIKTLFLGYILLIFLLSTLPLNSTNAFLSDTYFIEIRLDYLAHILIFLPFLFLIKQTFNPGLIPSLFLGLIFALTTEIIQYFLPYRSFNINDLIANVAGVTVGLFLFIPILYTFLLRLLANSSKK